VENDRVKSRRSRREKRILPPFRELLPDLLIIATLFLVSILAAILFGATRMWIKAPLIILSALAASGFFLRVYLARGATLNVPPGGILACLFLVYMLAQLSWSAVPHETWWQFLVVASYVLAYWIWSTLAAGFRRWRYLLGVLLLVTSLLGWYALVQHAQGSRAVLFFVRPEQYGMRASGTYLCPNHFAHLLEIVLCVSLALLFCRSAGWALRLTAGYALVVLLPVVLLTLSRSGWLGTCAGLYFTLLLLYWRKDRRWFYAIMIGMPLVVVLCGLGIWAVSPAVRERVAGASVSNPDASVGSRLLIWRDTLSMIADRWTLGSGAGTYRWVFLHYLKHQVRSWFRYAHNEYLHALAELGVVGFVFVIGLVGSVVLRLTRMMSRASQDRNACLVAGALGAIGASLVHAVFDFNFHIFANVHVLVMVVGVAVASLHHAGEWSPRLAGSRKARLALLGAVVCCLALCVAAAQAFITAGFTQRGEVQRGSLNYERALALYETAHNVDSRYWMPCLGIAHVYKTRSFWDVDTEKKQAYAEKALTWYDKAFVRNRYEMESLYGKSKVLWRMGRTDEALDLLREIIEIRPFDFYYLRELGVLLRRSGKAEEASEILDRARKIRPGDYVVRVNLRLLRSELKKGREE
jgi:O-antigen ligase